MFVVHFKSDIRQSATMLSGILIPQSTNKAQFLSCSSIAKRWRSHHPRTHRPPGRHPLDIKIAHPVKDRSPANVLPINKKIYFVTNGWWYDRSQKLEELQKPQKNFTPCLAFVRNEKHRLLHVFTASEIAEIEKLFPEIDKAFAEQKKLKPEQEADDLSREHVCM